MKTESYYQKNKERMRETARRHYQRHKGEINATAKAKRKETYVPKVKIDKFTGVLDSVFSESASKPSAFSFTNLAKTEHLTTAMKTPSLITLSNQGREVTNYCLLLNVTDNPELAKKLIALYEDEK